METVSAWRMCLEMRACYSALGIPGGIRFAREGGPLFTGSVPREPEKKARLLSEAEIKGYSALERESWIDLSPGLWRVRQEVAGLPLPEQNWPGSLACRFLLHEQEERVTENGMRLILETLRLGQSAANLNRGRPALRALCAENLAARDRSGLYESGVFLWELERGLAGRRETEDSRRERNL